MKMHRKHVRVIALIATASLTAIRSADALTNVTLNSTGSAAANPWGSGLWSDGSTPNVSTGSPSPFGDFYNVSGFTLYAPQITNTSITSNFYGGGLALTGATLTCSVSSNGNYTENYATPNSSTGIQLTNSTLAFAGTNTVHFVMDAPLNLSDTGSSTNVITVSGTGPSQYLNLAGAVSGSGILTFQFTGTETGRNIAYGPSVGTYTGAVVLGNTPGAATLTLNQSMGTVSSYTVGTNWTLADSANYTSGANASVTGTLKFNGITESLGNLTGAGTVMAANSSASTLTLNGAGTFSGTLTNGTGALSVTETGSGIQALSGTGGYTGTTTISSGTLQFGKEVSLYNNNTGNWTAANISVAGGGTLGLNVGGTAQFTASDVSTLLTNLGTGTGGFQSGSSIALDTTNASGGTFTYSSPITNLNSGAISIGLTKLGGGVLDLQASNSYTGPTVVSAGTLLVDSNPGNAGSLGATAVTVNAGATLLINGNTSIGSTLTLVGGSSSATQGLLDLRDGTIKTFNIGGNLTVGSGSFGAAIDLDFGSTSGSNDTLNVSGGVTTSGLTTINMNVLGTLAYGTYTLITDTAGGLAGGSGFTLGARPSGYGFSFASSTADDLILTVSNGNATPATAYWTGQASSTGSDTLNNWGFTASSGGTNWSNISGGTQDTGQVPGAITNVIFTASNATSAAGVLSTQLDIAYSINSLAFYTASAPAITSVGINTNGNTFNIGAGGITVAAGDTSSSTISGGSATLLLGTSQSWANNSSNQSLTVSAGIVGTATSGTETLTFAGNGSGAILINGSIGDGTGGGNLGLVFNQSGVTQLNASNTFTGGVTINSGTVRLGNSSALNSNTITFGPASTGDLQLNGNSLTVSSLNTNSTAIIEDAGAAPATLTINASSGTNTLAGVLRDGTGGGVLSISVPGASTLVLSGSNAYTGTTTLGGGATLMTTTAGAIPSASSLAFTGAATLNTSSPGLTVAGLTVAGSTSFTPTLQGITSVTVNTTSNTVIGGTTSGLTDTLDLSAISTFSFNGSSASLLIVSGNVSAQGGNGTLNLAPTSTVRVGTLDVGAAPNGNASSNGTTAGILALGTTNVIDANNIVVATRSGAPSTGSISFQAGLTNPTVTLAGFAGGSSTVNMIVGEDAGSDYSTATATVDFSAGTVNASFGTLSIGIHAYNNANFVETGTGTFTMGAGNVTANTIILGQTIPGGSNGGKTTSSGNGTFNLGTSGVTGGTLQVATLTMGDQQKETTSTSAVISTFNFNSGLLEAAVIQPGATQNTSAGAVTRTFNWNAGTIQNYNSATGLSISIPTITLASASNQTFDITAGQTGTVSSSIGGSGGAILKTDSGTLVFSGSNTYTGGTIVAGGSLQIASANAIPAGTNLNVGSGTSVVVNNIGAAIPVTIGSLTLIGKLDLNNNALIVKGTPFATVNSSVATGYNGGAWNNSTGIISSMAANDTTHLTAVGVIVNDDGTGNSQALYSTFENAPSVDGDVLVKYTYYGDTDLNGEVDGTDYSRIDNAFLNNSNSSNPQLTGWFNGDFNYDGVVNGSDYTLIDNAFNSQGAQIAAELASPLAVATDQVAGGSAVPEPTSLTLLGISAFGLLGRRSARRRK